MMITREQYMDCYRASSGSHDISLFFDSFTSDSVMVTLYYGGKVSAILLGDRAVRFINAAQDVEPAIPVQEAAA